MQMRRLQQRENHKHHLRGRLDLLLRLLRLLVRLLRIEMLGLDATVDLGDSQPKETITYPGRGRPRRMIKTDRLHHDAGDLIGAGVAGRSTVLKVAHALLADGSRDPDAGAPIGHPIRELIHRGRLVGARHAQGVVGAVHLDVLPMSLLELLDGGLDVLDAARFPHLIRRDVGVQAGAVPVALDRFRVEGDLGAKLLGDAMQQEPCQPEMITHWGQHQYPETIMPFT